MLSCAVSKLRTARLCTPKQRRAQVERQLSLLESLTTPGAVPVWNTLDDTARTETLHLLARLIAKVVVPTDEGPIDDDPEQSNE